MGLLLLEKPEGPAVSIELAQARLKYDDGEDDVADLEFLINAATQFCEKQTQRKFLTQRWALTLSQFPNSYEQLRNTSMPGWPDLGWVNLHLSRAGSYQNSCIPIPFPPLQSVELITYLDSAGVRQTLPTSDYVVDPSGFIGAVYPAPNKNWPAAMAHPMSVRIEFTCGYGESTDLDSDLVIAILLMVAHYDQNREAVSDREMYQLPLGVECHLERFVVPTGF